MSISIRIPIRDKEQHIPLASSNTFKMYWVPGIKALNLVWLNQIDACLLTPNNLEAITEEFRRLVIWFDQSHPPQMADSLTKQIKIMLPLLEALKDEKEFEIWIG